jgi:hypothetical protein
VTRFDLYATWGLLAIIALGISSVARAVIALRNDVADLRRKLLGEENEIS